MQKVSMQHWQGVWAKDRRGFEGDHVMQIGFIGVGLMGQGMVTRLLKAGHGVRVMAHRNRTPVEAVKAEGATETGDAAALAQGAGVVILCVDNAETVAALINSLKPHLKAGQIVIDTTTSDPRLTEALAKDLARQKVGLADAPMTGGPEQVAAGEAGALVGADAATFATIAPVIGCYCARVHHFGEPGAGHRAKLISNYLVMGMIGVIADSYKAARQAGVDWGKLYDVQLLGSTNSGALKKMVGPALKGDYDGYRFSMVNAEKDMRYYCTLAESLGMLSPLAQETYRMFQAASRHGGKNVSRLLDPSIEEQQP
ncbi:MAG: NAD(P)-dependent oxidoreductase [Aestuariivirgaceae bacterium]